MWLTFSFSKISGLAMQVKPSFADPTDQPPEVREAAARKAAEVELKARLAEKSQKKQKKRRRDSSSNSSSSGSSSDDSSSSSGDSSSSGSSSSDHSSSSGSGSSSGDSSSSSGSDDGSSSASSGKIWQPWQMCILVMHHAAQPCKHWEQWMVTA